MTSPTLDEIVFFDLPSKTGTAWSLNSWRTRLILNYKGISYRTEWTEYPDIKVRLEGHVEPADDDPPFTIPTIKLADGTYITNSNTIARVLEEKYPSPPLHLASPQLAQVRAVLISIWSALRPIYLPQMPRRLLGKKSIPYFVQTRSKAVGMPLDQFELEQGGQPAYDRAAPLLREMTALLEEDAGGPFLMGATLSYADFCWAGFVLHMRAVGEDVWQEILERTGNPGIHEEFLEAMRPWTVRNDH